MEKRAVCRDVVEHSLRYLQQSTPQLHGATSGICEVGKFQILTYAPVCVHLARFVLGLAQRC